MTMNIELGKARQWYARLASFRARVDMAAEQLAVDIRNDEDFLTVVRLVLETQWGAPTSRSAET